MIQTQRRFDLNLTVDDYLRIVRNEDRLTFLAAAISRCLISEADST